MNWVESSVLWLQDNASAGRSPAHQHPFSFEELFVLSQRWHSQPLWKQQLQQLRVEGGKALAPAASHPVNSEAVRNSSEGRRDRVYSLLPEERVVMGVSRRAETGLLAAEVLEVSAGKRAEHAAGPGKGEGLCKAQADAVELMLPGLGTDLQTPLCFQARPSQNT